MADNKSSSDLWIVAGVVVCLGIGAAATFYLSGAGDSPRKKPVAVVQGELINSKPDPTKVADTPTQAKATTPTPNQPTGNGDFLTVTFDTLGSYYYEIPNLDAPQVAAPAVKPAPDAPKVDPKKPKDQIPAPIKAFSGKKVAVQGFMVPIKIEKGATKSFLLVKDQSLCCYGRMPRMNEWISVRMSGDKAAKFIGDQPVTVFGKIDVGEEIEKGEVLSIYRMEADDVAGPLDL